MAPVDGDGSSPPRKPLVMIGIAAVAVIVLGAGLLQLTGGDDDGLTTEEILARNERGDRYANATTDRPDTAERGYALTTPNHLGVRLKDLRDAELVGVDYALTVVAAGLVDEIELPTRRLEPAEGETFVVVRYEVDGARTTSMPEAAIDVDGVKRTVHLGGGAQTLVQAVDEDAELADIGLNLTERDTDQTVSLATGRREGPDPRILYRDQRNIALNQSISLPYDVASPTSWCAGAGVADLALGGAELIWSGADTTLFRNSSVLGQLRPPSEPDMAWLVLDIDRFRAAGPSSECTYAPEIPAERIVIVGPDGTEYTSGSPLNSATFALVFPAPADLTSARLELRPGAGNSHQGAAGIAYDFGSAVAALPITFPADSR